MRGKAKESDRAGTGLGGKADVGFVTWVRTHGYVAAFAALVVLDGNGALSQVFATSVTPHSKRAVRLRRQTAGRIRDPRSLLLFSFKNSVANDRYRAKADSGRFPATHTTT